MLHVQRGENTIGDRAEIVCSSGGVLSLAVLAHTQRSQRTCVVWTTTVMLCHILIVWVPILLLLLVVLRG